MNSKEIGGIFGGTRNASIFIGLCLSWFTRWQVISASKRLRNYRELVEAAIQQSCGEALQFASSELKQDKDIFMLAIAKSGRARWSSSESLHGDKECALMVGWNLLTMEWSSVKKTRSNIKFAFPPCPATSFTTAQRNQGKLAKWISMALSIAAVCLHLLFEVQEYELIFFHAMATKKQGGSTSYEVDCIVRLEESSLSWLACKI